MAVSIWPSMIYITVTCVAFSWKLTRLKSGGDFTAAVIAELLLGGLLYWGGFFDPLLR